MRWLVLAIAVGAFVAAWMASRQARSKARLVRRIYKHEDELLGARRYENDRRATRRHYLSYVDEHLAALLYPNPKLGGAVALPSTGRMRLYVEIDWPLLPAGQRYTLQHIRYAPITLHWTSEAAVNVAGFFEWIERGRATSGGGLAAALGLEWTDGLFTQRRDFARAQVTLTARRPVKTVPLKLELTEDANGL